MDLLPLPHVFAADAPDRLGWLLFGQLLFADWTRFGHHVRHSLTSWTIGLFRSMSHTKRLNSSWAAGTATASVVCPTGQINGTHVRHR